MSKTTKWVLIIGGVVFLMFLVAQPEPEPQVIEVVREVVREVEVDNSQYNDDVFEEGFMEGCTENSPELKSYCECAYKYMLNKYGIEEMIKMGLSENPEDSEMVESAVIYCLN